jgi:flagellar protein FlbD
MITLHRLGHKLEIFRLNPDLIVTVEATPDTVLTLATGHKIVVAETPERVVAEIKAYRVDILAGALRRRHELRSDGSAPARGHVRLAHSNNDQDDRAQA